MVSFSSLLRFLGQTPFRRSVVAIFAVTAVCAAWLFGGDGLSLMKHSFSVVSASAPHIALTAPPMIIENKTLLLSYDASDNTGIREIVLRMTPHDKTPGAKNAPIEISLPVRAAKQISRTDSQNLTAYPWAGKKVTFQIVAINDAGKRALTGGVDFTLPERRFFHPVARVLIEERDKLMENPDDNVLREEAASIMANIAHSPSNYRNDPVILMALRGGAVRLVLGHDHDASLSVSDILWQAAARIEDSFSQRTVRDMRQDSSKDF
ncbi:MAG: DUF4175 family protein [Bdellovibrionales bacterium]